MHGALPAKSPHVDCGYNVMGFPGRAIEKVKKLILDKVKAADPVPPAATLENDSELKCR